MADVNTDLDIDCTLRDTRSALKWKRRGPARIGIYWTVS